MTWQCHYLKEIVRAINIHEYPKNNCESYYKQKTKKKHKLGRFIFLICVVHKTLGIAQLCVCLEFI